MKNQMLDLESRLAEAVSPAFQIYAMPRGRGRQPAQPRQHADQRQDVLAVLLGQAKALQAKADAERRSLTEAENEAVDAIFATFARTETELSGVESEPEPSARPQGRRTDPDDVYHGGLGRHAPAGDTIKSSPSAPGTKGRMFHDLFAHIPIAGSDMPVMDFVRNVAKGVFDPRLVRAAQGEDEGARGGFAVPGAVVRAVWDAMIEQSVILPRAMIFPTAANSITVPRPDIANRSVNLAGLQGRWIAEGGTFGVDTAAVTQTTYRLKKLGTLIKISNEWLEDVPPQNASLFSDLVAAVLTFDLDSSFFLGTGAAMPMGLVNATSAVTVAKESGQAGDTIEFPNVLNAWSRLHPSCQQNAVWFCSPSCLPQLALMQFSRSATNPVPVYLPANGAAGQPFATLMGKPLIPTEYQPHVGDEGDLILTDLGKYGIAMKPAMVLDRSDHRYFETDEVALRGKIRCDAGPLWSDAHTPRGDGGQTLSWCVRIAARA